MDTTRSIIVRRRIKCEPMELFRIGIGVDVPRFGKRPNAELVSLAYDWESVLLA